MKNKLIVALQLLPVILSFLLIAAHFYRAGNQYLAYFLVVIPFILIIKSHITAKIVQLLLFLATIEWWRVIYNIAHIRMKFGMPWIRFTLIMSLVAIFTLLSIFVFYTKTLRKIYFD